jgi:excisionase family DNA binding protein
MSKTLAVKEAAAKIGVHADTLRRGLREGTVRGVKVREHGPWRVPISEVARLEGESQGGDEGD